MAILLSEAAAREIKTIIQQQGLPEAETRLRVDFSDPYYRPTARFVMRRANTLRDVVTKINDTDRDLGAVKGALEKKMASDVLTRVVYTENHDQVGHPPGQNRLPTLIDTSPENACATESEPGRFE